MSVNMISFVLLFQLINNVYYYGYIWSLNNKFVWPIFELNWQEETKKGSFRCTLGTVLIG